MGKTGWKRIFQLEDVNICQFLGLQFGTTGKLPMIGSVFKFYRETFPRLPKKCPFVPGNYGFDGLEIGISQTENFNFFGQTFNAGFYRHVIRFSTDQEKDAYLLYWILQIIDD